MLALARALGCPGEKGRASCQPSGAGRPSSSSGNSLSRNGTRKHKCRNAQDGQGARGGQRSKSSSHHPPPLRHPSRYLHTPLGQKPVLSPVDTPHTPAATRKPRERLCTSTCLPTLCPKDPLSSRPGLSLRSTSRSTTPLPMLTAGTNLRREGANRRGRGLRSILPSLRSPRCPIPPGRLTWLPPRAQPEQLLGSEERRSPRQAAPGRANQCLPADTPPPGAGGRALPSPTPGVPVPMRGRAETAHRSRRSRRRARRFYWFGAPRSCPIMSASMRLHSAA